MRNLTRSWQKTPNLVILLTYNLICYQMPVQTGCVKCTERLRWILDTNNNWIKNESIDCIKRSKLYRSERVLILEKMFQPMFSTTITTTYQNLVKTIPKPHQNHTKTMGTATPKPYQKHPNHTKTIPNPYRKHTKTVPAPDQNHTKPNGTAIPKPWNCHTKAIL